MYRLFNLQPRSKRPKRRKRVATCRVKIKPTKPTHAWSMDFVEDQLANGMKFRKLTIVDVSSKEALAIEGGQAAKKRACGCHFQLAC